ncbi:MAG: GDSL family lipase [Gammaproteobacteria bacterium]|nr:MAG: GDSL family lipase [Gammaproteobacteria bacterium]
MMNILVYADSLSWGIIPGTRRRLDFADRWPGVLERRLDAGGDGVRVIENCLNGRRTVWDDPFKAGRNGAHGLAQAIEMHSPLDLVVLMLGTNDFQRVHLHNAWLSAQGVATLIGIIRTAPIEPGMPVPEVLVVCPPQITRPRGEMAEKFEGAEERYGAFPEELARVCGMLDAFFFDANEVVRSSAIDGIHLDAEAHVRLGEALAEEVRRRFPRPANR